MLEEAKKLMEDISYMSLDDDKDGFLLYSTRDNGDVYKEEYGAEDLIHARKCKEQLEENGFTAEIEAVDEWIMLTVIE